MFDTAGNLYGVIEGTIYELSPTPGGGPWTETVLYTFPRSDYSINGELIFDAAGNLYGTTQFGGNTAVTCDLVETPPPGAGCGVVFKLTPTASGPWTETVLYEFGGADDGGWPRSGVIFDRAGNLYGTASAAGAGLVGVVYKLTPTATGPWTQSLLYTFCPGQGLCPDGAAPFTGVTFDNIGNLYGTVDDSDPDGASGVFKLTPTPNGSWKEELIALIPDSTGDAEPLASLKFRPTRDRCVRDADRENDRGRRRDARRDEICGEFYGTSRLGGPDGLGDVFRVSPTESGVWEETELYDFNTTDGRAPTSAVVFDDAGNLYGTTVWGGTKDEGCLDPGCGVVFELTPTPTPPWTYSPVYNFPGGTQVGWPGGLSFGPGGNLYGPSCGAVGVFELTPPATTTALKR